MAENFYSLYFGQVEGVISNIERIHFNNYKLGWLEAKENEAKMTWIYMR